MAPDGALPRRRAAVLVLAAGCARVYSTIDYHPACAMLAVFNGWRGSMTSHHRHILLAVIVAAILLALASVSAHAQDFSNYTGAELYKRFCSSCHGAHAKGDGPVAKSFKIEVPDLTRISQRHGGQFPADQIKKIIDGRQVLPPHGSREMPVWGFEFYLQNQNAGHEDPQHRTEAIIARLTDYLRSLQLE